MLVVGAGVLFSLALEFSPAELEDAVELDELVEPATPVVPDA